MASRSPRDNAGRRGKAFQRSDSLLEPPTKFGRPLLETAVDAEIVRPVLGNIWIELGLTTDCDEIGLLVLKYGLGLLRFENDADGHSGNISFLANPLGIGDLKAQAAWHLVSGSHTGDATRGAIDHIDPARLQFASKDDRVIHIPAAQCAVDRRV